ncbi:MAG: class I SAM-dependent methyltransferase [Candidatus Hodarchaeota archaeon]
MKERYYFDIKTKRPEELFENAKDYFNLENIRKYSKSKSMMRIQEKITKRALELLEIKKSKIRILDAGCGPGFASFYLKEIGFEIVALDIISDFLRFYNLTDVNPLAADMCYLPFKPNSFDAIISISALQWIFRNLQDKKMEILLIQLTKSFYKILKSNSKAVIQFYPKNNEIMEKIGNIFITNTNFEGNFIIDNPNNPKKRKIFLLLKKE